MKKATSRLFILATLLFAPVYLAHAQKPTAIPRIGVLYLGAPLPTPTSMYLFKSCMNSATLRGRTFLLSTAMQRERKIVFLSSRRNWSD